MVTMFIMVSGTTDSNRYKTKCGLIFLNGIKNDILTVVEDKRKQIADKR